MLISLIRPKQNGEGDKERYGIVTCMVVDGLPIASTVTLQEPTFAAVTVTLSALLLDASLESVTQLPAVNV